MKRFVAVLMMVSGLLVAGGARATYTITFAQSGSDVVASGSGTLILTALTRIFTNVNSSYQLNGSSSTVTIGGDVNHLDVYSASTGPANFGSNVNTFANSGTNDTVGLLNSGTRILVPTGYNPNGSTSLSGTATYTNATIASLGLTPGTYTYSWGTGATADSLVIVIPAPAPAPSAVPTLSEWAQLMLGLMVMMLTGWHFHRERSY